MADFFNANSNECTPLDFSDIPCTFRQALPTISREDVIKKIKCVRKPNSQVPGDLPPALWTLGAKRLSEPIANIFNCITESKQWPQQRNIKYVTIIPKTMAPDTLGDCRNISCTNFWSKLYENFVHEWACLQIVPKTNQYRGEKKCGSTHFLLDALDEITSAMEDNRNVCIVTSIDFSKAFNRLQHSACLKAFEKRGPLRI